MVSLGPIFVKIEAFWTDMIHIDISANVSEVIVQKIEVNEIEVNEIK